VFAPRVKHIFPSSSRIDTVLQYQYSTGKQVITKPNDLAIWRTRDLRLCGKQVRESHVREQVPTPDLQCGLLEEKISLIEKPLKLLSRSSMVFPSFVGLNFLVFNGLKFISLSINEQMVGHKFGEFIMTKKQVNHKKAR
jgi:small subunit ribosomal protein S19